MKLIRDLRCLRRVLFAARDERYDSPWSLPSSRRQTIRSVVFVPALGILSFIPSGQALAQTGPPCQAWRVEESAKDKELFGVWGTSGTDVFAVGEGGTVQHYDGTRWEVQASGVKKHLTAVHGSAAGNVFAVGEGGTILHYDGERWRAQGSGTTRDLHGVWVASPSDAFAVGEKGTALHFDGSKWAPQTTGKKLDIAAVWGRSPTEVFAVGDGLRTNLLSQLKPEPNVLRYDGKEWRSEPQESTGFLTGVWGTPTGEVFAVSIGERATGWARSYVGDGGLIGAGRLIRYDGKAWTAERIEVFFANSNLLQYPPLHAISGQSGSDFFVISTSYARGNIVPVAMPSTILHFDGSRWTQEFRGVKDTRGKDQEWRHWRAIWVGPTGEAIAVGWKGLVLRRSSSSRCFDNQGEAHWRGQMQHKDAAVRREAATALGAIGLADAVPALIGSIADEDESVRYAVVRALGEMGPLANEALPKLREVSSNDKSPAIRQAAGLAVRSIERNDRSSAAGPP